MTDQTAVKHLLAAVALALPVPAAAHEFTYPARVVSIYDGDTITVDVRLGFDVTLAGQSIRLLGIDTPEIRGDERPEGLVSRDWLRERIPPGTWITLTVPNDERGKYGRPLGIILHDGENLNEVLVERGLAEPYP